MFEYYADTTEKEVKPPAPGVVKAAYNGEDFETDYNEHLGEGEECIENATKMEDADPRMYGLVQTRKLGILTLQRKINGTGKEADFVRDVFRGIPNMFSILDEILWCGYAVGRAIAELEWQPRESNWVIANIHPRNPGKFIFDKENKTKLISEDNKDGKVVEDIKFPVYTFNGRFGNKYGTSLYQKIYWYHEIKKKIIKFWAIYCDKNALPTVVANAGELSEEQEEVLERFIKHVRSATSVRLPEGVVIDLLQASHSGAVNNFKSFLAYIDAAISIAILGQTLTSDIGDRGSYAATKVHDEVRHDILQYDIQRLKSYVNDFWVKPLVDLNFSNVKEYPEWHIVTIDDYDIKVMAEVINTLLKLKVKTIPISWIHKIFGIPVPADGEECLIPIVPEARGVNKEENKDKFSEMNLESEKRLFF